MELFTSNHHENSFLCLTDGINHDLVKIGSFFYAGSRGQKVVVSQKTPNFRPKLEKTGLWRHIFIQNDVIKDQFWSSFNSGHIDTSHLFVRRIVFEISMILILWSIYRKNAILRYIWRHCDVISWSIFDLSVLFSLYCWNLQNKTKFVSLRCIVLEISILWSIISEKCHFTLYMTSLWRHFLIDFRFVYFMLFVLL